MHSKALEGTMEGREKRKIFSQPSLKIPDSHPGVESGVVGVQVIRYLNFLTIFWAITSPSTGQHTTLAAPCRAVHWT